MISGLRGEIFAKDPTYCDILTAGGVIYRVSISLNCYSMITDSVVTLYTTNVVREDAHLLFGFLDKSEQYMFEKLIKVNKVGPKVAMAVCSTFLPNVFADAISNQDLIALSKVPGVGKKLAGMILVQLGEFTKEILDSKANPATKSHTEASMALETLGFRKDNVLDVLSKCKSTTTQELIKEALKYFQK